MQKEEIFALLDQLAIDQDKFNKFREYQITFIRQPRCKKGCLEFLTEIFDSENVAGSKELALRLLSVKSYQNSSQLDQFINHHPITQAYNKALIDARILIMQRVSEYIKELSVRLDKSDLVDKWERQVYLRRAVARLATIYMTSTQVAITVDQWPEVEAQYWIDYLTTTLDELTGRICELDRMKEWADVYGDYYHLDRPEVIRSVRNFMDYLDTFLTY